MRFKDAILLYKFELNSINNWIETEQVDANELEDVSRALVYELYDKWCSDNNINTTASRQTLYKFIEDKFCLKSKQIRVYHTGKRDRVFVKKEE